MSSDYSTMTHSQRVANLFTADERMEWNARLAEATGSQSHRDIICQIRQRSKAARKRTNWIFLALIITILVGLAYYVGLPIWQQLEDGNKRAYETEAQFLDDAMQEMDIERNARWQEIVKTLGIVASPMSTRFSEIQEQISYSQITESGTLLGISTGGRFFRLQNTFDPLNLTRVGNLTGNAPGLVSSNDGQNILVFGGNGNNRWGQAIMAAPPKVGSPRSSIIRTKPAELTWPMYASTDGGENWKTANPPNSDQSITKLMQWGDDGTFIILSGELIYRSENFGLDWVEVNFDPGSEVVKSFHRYQINNPDQKLDEHLIAELSDGSLIITRDAGITWQEFFSAEELPSSDTYSLNYISAENIEGEIHILVDYETGFDTGSGETKRFFSRDDGKTWESDDNYMLPVSVIDFVGDLVLDGTGFNFYDDGGLIEKVADEDDGTIIASFPIVEDFGYSDIEKFSGPFAILSAWLKNDRMGFVATADGGDTWQLVPVNTSDTISGVTNIVRFGQGETEEFVFHYAQAGTSKFLQFDDRFQAAFTAYSPAPGEDGDEAMEALIRGVPTQIYDDLYIKQKVAAFRNAIRDRRQLSNRLATTKALAAEILGSGYSPAQRRRDYGEFLNTCKAGGATPDKCSETYIELTDTASKSVWEIVAERAPQAVLLLFLLATLANLYRYNLRLSGFYAARADFLELLEIESAKNGESLLTQWGHAAELANTLAADKVEFGKNSNPTDQGIAFAQSLLNKKA